MDASLIGRGLAARLRDLEAALVRLDAFAFLPGDEGPAGTAPPDGARRAEAARDLVLRALRVMSDPLNDRIMLRLGRGEAKLEELGDLLSLPRLSVWERVGDLVQVGLAARSLEGDRVSLTAAGRGLLDLVGELADAARGGEA